MRRAPSAGQAALIALAIATSGCAHHQKNQYAYAPPYAPPVYPQPASFSQPPVTGVPPVAAVGPAVAAPTAPLAPGMNAAPCPPETVTAAQTSPCPPGEYIVPGSMVNGEMPCPPGP